MNEGLSRLEKLMEVKFLELKQEKILVKMQVKMGRLQWERKERVSTFRIESLNLKKLFYNIYQTNEKK